MKYFVLIMVLITVGCGNKKKYHDKIEVAKAASNALNEIYKYQETQNRSFKDPKTSPLPGRYRKSFEGLDFFSPDTNYRVKAKLVRTPEAIPFMMPTTTDRETEEVVYGVAHFVLNGKQYQLEIYKGTDQEDENYLFLPFMDATNGEETYGGGRYIDLSIPDADILLIDFNKAYNPYCAYNKKYSCPKVPVVNTLNLKIEAGVKTFVP